MLIERLLDLSSLGGLVRDQVDECRMLLNVLRALAAKSYISLCNFSSFSTTFMVLYSLGSPTWIQSPS